MLKSLFDGFQAGWKFGGEITTDVQNIQDAAAFRKARESEGGTYGGGDEAKPTKLTPDPASTGSGAATPYTPSSATTTPGAPYKDEPQKALPATWIVPTHRLEPNLTAPSKLTRNPSSASWWSRLGIPTPETGVPSEETTTVPFPTMPTTMGWSGGQALPTVVPPEAMAASGQGQVVMPGIPRRGQMSPTGVQPVTGQQVLTEGTPEFPPTPPPPTMSSPGPATTPQPNPIVGTYVPGRTVYDPKTGRYVPLPQPSQVVSPEAMSLYRNRGVLPGGGALQ